MTAITLVLDTSARGMQLALISGSHLLAHQVLPQARGESLYDHLSELLSQAQVSLANVNDVVVALGPGSFTGLRAGIAFAEGLCLAGHRTLHGVSTLHLRALQAPGCQGVLLRARPGYWYLRDSQGNEFFWDQDQVFQWMKSQNTPLVLACDELVSGTQPDFADLPVNWIAVGVDSSLMVVADVIGELAPRHACGANYLQPSYAERSLPKSSS